MSLNDLVTERLKTAAEAIASLQRIGDELTKACELAIATIEGGGMIATCGNGGSAAQALHLAEELMGRYRADRRPLPGVCLNADPTLLTCIANDYGFDAIFARQCEALLNEGDLLLTFSTSGKSPNIIRALKTARSKGVRTMGLLGPDDSPCHELCDIAISSYGTDTAMIQDAHQVVLHLLCEAIEQSILQS
jgi:D-sedoheptulose 7-phosphate isomerase